jgi:predicted lipid-binding transport protein (Tim44 family)
LNQKNSKQKQQIERGEQQVEDLKKKLDDAKNRPGEVTSYQLMMSITNALDAYAVHAKQLDETNKMQERELYLNTIRAAFGRLEQAYGRKDYGDMSDEEIKTTVAKKVKKLSAAEPDDEIAALTSSMDEDELAALMED